MIGYLDSSMVVDRAPGIARGEASSPTNEARVDRWISSEITVVELHRVLRRMGHDRDIDALVVSALGSVEVLQLASPTIRLAASLPVRFLKSLDAIHIASALLAQCDVVFTRDQQMQRACSELGLATSGLTPHH